MTMHRVTVTGSLWRAGICLAAALPVLLLWCCSEASASFPAGMTESLYARAGGGVFFLDLLESSPFVETNSREEAVDFLDHYDASLRAGPLTSLMIGSDYRAFGRRLFTEANGFLTFHESRHRNAYDRRGAAWDSVRRNTLENRDTESLTPEQLADLILDEMRARPDIRFVGWVGAIDGTALPATPSVEYLTHAPKVRYVGRGEPLGNGTTHSPARLVYADAFGLSGRLSIGIHF